MVAFSEKVFTSLRWTFFVRLIAQLFSWVVTIYVIRILSPEDYGLNALAAMVFSTLLLLSTVTIETAIIQSDTFAREQVRQYSTMVLSINLLLTVMLCATVIPIAEFFNEPDLVMILLVFSSGFIISSFVSIPSALLRRELLFKPHALADLWSSALHAFTVLILALYGVGVWALVIGHLLSLLTKAIMLAYYHPWWQGVTWHWYGVEPQLKYGAMIAGTSLIWLACWKVDLFIGGIVLDATVIGLYVVAFQLASLPLEKIMPLLHQVAFPAYAQLQGDRQEVKKSFLTAVSMVGVFTFPLYFGFAAISETFVDYVLGEKWTPIVMPIMLLSVILPLRAITTMYTPLVNAMGRADLSMKNAVLTLVLLSGGLLTTAKWGVIGLAVAWCISYPLIFILSSRLVLPLVGVSSGELASVLVPPLFAGGAMMAGVLLIAGDLQIMELHPIMILITQVVVGILLYLVLMMLFSRGQSLSAFNFLKRTVVLKA